MVSGRVGRALGAVSAVAVMVGAVAGCGGGGDAGAAGKPVASGPRAGSPTPSVSAGSASPGVAAGKPGTSRTATASPYAIPSGTPAARSGPPSRNRDRLVSQREIDSYVLMPKDVPGHDISTTAGRTTTGTEMPVRLMVGSGLPRVSPAGCQHVYENSQQASDYRQNARADDMVSGPGDTVEVSLTAYRPQDAHKVLADLRAALPGCTSYAVPLGDGMGFEHPQVLPDPQLGDEALEYGIMQKVPADKSSGQPTLYAPFHYLLVRKGSVIAWFQVMAFPGQTASLPMDVVKAQVAKLP